jgi:hypothetical protein
MTFNPIEELRKIADASRSMGGRKLNFAEQCAAFAALYEDTPPMIVRRAFRISPQTASKLAGCLAYDPDPYVRETAEEIDKDGSNYRVVQRITPHDHNDGRKAERVRHYDAVAREFEALGREEFIHRYMTPRIVEKLAAARHEIQAERAS